MSGPKLTAVRATSLAEQAYEQLLEKITTGEYQDGHRIVIDDVAEQLGISRIPVREALARLSAEHLLEYQKNKGYTVVPKVEHDKLFEARLIIEPSVIRYCGNKITDAKIKQLKAINRKISRLVTGKRFKQYVDFLILNDQFHAAIIDISDNRLITEAYRGLSYGPQFARHTHGRGIPDLKTNVEEHDRIITALEDRDIDEAVRASEEHIQEGLKRFETYWD